MKFFKEKYALKITIITCIVLYLTLQVMIRIIPIPLENLKKPTSTLVFDKNGELLRAFTSSDGMWRINTSLNQISPELKKFQITYEDRWFYFHPGINPLSIIRATIQNIRNWEVISGGSTITMQIARMMEPKERTFINKIIEAFRSFQLEHYFTKDELLEIYFNIAPYGGNIEGVAAASWIYFGKEPTQLSYAEAALLTALPNSPSYLRPDQYPEAAKKARDKILARMLKNRVINQKEYEEALIEPVPVKRTKWPFIAPHLTRELHLENKQASRIYSTIDKDTQLIAEKLLSRHLAKLKDKNITNGAIVVIDNKTHELVAMVGSEDFFNDQNSGQVNGALALRSPGSTLKPFIYALGIMQGVISPSSVLEDVPIDYNGYAPENYDRKFSGIVSAKEALERSLNVPAVNLNAMLLDKQSLYDLLKKAAISNLQEEKIYGLSIALGGCDISLLELTGLYSALASNGDYYGVKMQKDQPLQEAIHLFDKGTCFIITEILSEVRRPDLPAVWQFTTLPKVAWKTGTSFGHRDAWSIGYNPLYTIGVWIGNFDAQPSSALVGANAAAPLLFDLFTELCRNKQIEWFFRPEEVGVRKVCSLSGKLPNEYCPSTTEEYYLINYSPIDKCDFHKVVLLDAETGYRLPANYSGNRSVEKKIYTQWPPRIATWMIKNGYDVYNLPELLPEYQKQVAGQPPVITSPKKNIIYYLRPNIPLEYQKIVFSASVSNDVRKVYWFLDGKLLGSTNIGESLYYIPEVGKHQVVCQDDFGRMSMIELIIEKDR